MTTCYKETNIFELIRDETGFAIKFRCPSCKEIATVKTELPEGTHIDGCENCGSTLIVTLRLVIEYETQT